MLPLLPNEFRVIKRFGDPGQETFENIARRTQLLILSSEDKSQRAAFERTALQWLYEAVRGNILRGRAFEWQRVITERRADCLGYARLFQTLGRHLGLDIGVAEVIIDNAGRCVPHFVNIVRISNGTARFVDAWYGSTDILHKRLGIQIWRDNNWLIRDIDATVLPTLAAFRGIPSRCIYATTLFMLGNRHLERSLLSNDNAELDRALQYYDTAIALYPENPRFRFNRAIALDNKGFCSEAESDYRWALTDEERLLRILARQHDDVIRLISLDDKGINATDQRLYLAYKGFTTGTPVAITEVANQNKLTVQEVEETIQRVEAAVAASDYPGSGPSLSL